MKAPKNPNYAAIVVEIKTLIPLDNCNNVQHASIMGNLVIVGNDTKIGNKGVYFPLETQLSNEFLSHNNLFRKKELNIDPEKTGYFEENGRVRCVKFRGNKSEGFFIPLNSLDFLFEYSAEEELSLGSEFDEINGIEICRKYIPKHSRTPGAPGSRKKGKSIDKPTKLVEGQFRFHDDTSMLYKNLHRFNPNKLISITYKIHGTSGISSKLICKKKLTWFEKFLKWTGVNITDTHYDYIYASRKVIKNPDLNPNAQHFYGEDIWGSAHNDIKHLLLDGMTLYYEIAGYLPSGAMIQKDYDYGHSPVPEGDSAKPYGIYVYRITFTNAEGKVFEFSARQVQDWCKTHGLNAVPELYYGYASAIAPYETETHGDSEEFRNAFLENLKTLYNDKDCFMCIHKVPEEGCVVRMEGLDFEGYKVKSNLFYERETKLLDKGETNIEDEN